MLALGLLAALPAASPTGAAPVVRTLGDARVSGSQDYAQMTPIAVHGGRVFVVTIEPGPNGDGERANDLEIAVRQGVPDGAGGHAWTRTVIETRGVYDRWHTAPSVGVDEEGYVHVAYNMHNFPWQYAVSRRPLDITGGFDFRGQPVTQAELDLHTFRNRTSFPDLGSASVPGNQITYPAFENDRAGRLYLSYRFAAKPARDFEERTFSTGIARYDAGARTWSSLGGLLDYGADDYAGPDAATTTLRSVASATGWTSYVPRMTFGPDGALSVSTMWRSGIAGATTTDPCTFVTRDDESFATLDGTAVTVPVRPADCPNVDTAVPGTDYYSVGDAASDEAGHPYLLVSPVNRPREIHRWTGTAWVVEPSPGYAVEIFFDDEWNLWALSQGMSLYLKRAGSEAWETVRQASSAVDCLPDVGIDPDDRSVAHVFSLDCTRNVASVTRYDLRELRGDDAVPTARIAPLTLPRMRWQQISIPFDVPGMTPASVFGGVLPVARYGTGWTLFGFDAAAGRYVRPGRDEPLRSDRGYWMLQDVSDTVVVEAPAGAPAPLATGDRACAGPSCSAVPLTFAAGNAASPAPLTWQLGAVPVQGAAPLADVRIASGPGGPGGPGACTAGCTLAAATAANLVGSPLYRYDPAAGRYDSLTGAGTLQPWDGYWAAALPGAAGAGVRLLFPSAGGVSRGASEVLAAPAAPPTVEVPGPTRGPSVDDRAVDG